MGLHLSDPVPHVVEAFLRRAVICDNDTLDISEICLGDCSISLLASCVPYLKFDSFAIHLDRFDLEINANSWDMRDVRVLVGKLKKEASLANT